MADRPPFSLHELAKPIASDRRGLRAVTQPFNPSAPAHTLRAALSSQRSRRTCGETTVSYERKGEVLKRLPSLILMLAICTLVACSGKPSEEDLAQIAKLNSELEELETDIRLAEEKNLRFSGGLVKALVEARLETLLNTRALLQQRIHALEGGADIDVSAPGSSPDQELADQIAEEIASQEQKLKEAKAESDRYSGGLVKAMKEATVATNEQTLAMLNHRFLAAKYGLPSVSVDSAQAPEPADMGSLAESGAIGSSGDDPDVADEIVTVRLIKKRFAKQNYQDYIFFDIEFTAEGLDKPARAIKGVLRLQDLFGEPRMNIGWTIEDPVAPGQTVIEKGTGFEFNQFMDDHQWVRSTELRNMTASMTVRSILYQDGTRRDL